MLTCPEFEHQSGWCEAFYVQSANLPCGCPFVPSVLVDRIEQGAGPVSIVFCEISRKHYRRCAYLTPQNLSNKLSLIRQVGKVACLSACAMCFTSHIPKPTLCFWVAWKVILILDATAPQPVLGGYCAWMLDLIIGRSPLLVHI